MSFQLFLLVGHLTNWTGHNLLTDSTLKKNITHDMLARCFVIVSDHNSKLAGHFQNLVDWLLFPALYIWCWYMKVMCLNCGVKWSILTVNIMIFFYSSKIEVSGSKLLFKDTTLDEAGIYQCSAENKHGMIVSSTYVKVLGECVSLELVKMFGIFASQVLKCQNEFVMVCQVGL